MALGKIYSTRFIAVAVKSAATSALAVYTVPVGKVAVVRTIDILGFGAGDVYIGNQTRDVYWLSTRGMAANTERHWTGDQVVPAGEVIRCLWVSGDMSVTASGFLLSTT